MTDADSFTIPLLVADFGFWTLVADVEFWTLVADLDFGHSWPIISFRPRWPVGFWAIEADLNLDSSTRF